MIMLLSESSRYMPYLERKMKIKFKKIEEKTELGNIDIYLGENIIFINNMGLDKGNGNRETPLIIAKIMEKYAVKALGMVTKVGGINNTFNVGDLVIIEDYIDFTTDRCKSYLCNDNPKTKLRYSMNKPFCNNWKNSFLKEYLLLEEGKERRNMSDNVTYICTEGPGFESNAEINMFRNMGADVVGHWISPFVYYARELKCCFLSIGIVSNIYSREQKDMDNTEANNELFANIFNCVYESYNNRECDCQSKYIIENQLY